MTDAALARNTDPKTSHDAARSVEVSRLESEVLELLKRWRHTGLTTEDIAEKLGLELGSITPRMRPLVNKGLVTDSHKRRPGKSGKNRIVWLPVVMPYTPDLFL